MCGSVRCLIKYLNKILGLDDVSDSSVKLGH